MENLDNTYIFEIGEGEIDTNNIIGKHLKFYFCDFCYENVTYNTLQDRCNFLYQALFDTALYKEMTDKMSEINGFDNNKIVFLNAFKNNVSRLKVALKNRYNISCEFETNYLDKDGYLKGAIFNPEQFVNFIESILSDEQMLLNFLFGETIIYSTGGIKND